ncbi:MAG: cadherin-like domain-containing protein [Xanthomonadales bacterium]|nr:cadherin-like domain-containing protein [Xanthomonadales bacterium]
MIAFTGTLASPTVIYAANSEGTGWQADATSSNTSALPTGLVDGTTAVALTPEADNWAYTGTTSGTPAELLAAIGNVANWTSDNTNPVAYPSSFTVSAGTPNLSIDDVSMAEGDAGTTTFTFTVSIDNTSGSDVTFDYVTVDGTATTADSDYVGITTTAGTITAGNLTTTIDVTVNGDTTIESDEDFTVELSSVVGANVTDGVGTGTILDDDAPDWIINEFQSDPAPAGDANGDGVSSTTDDEFVEIYNNSGSAADISGWTLKDAVGVKHTFPPSTTIPANCAIVVFGGGTPTGTFGYATVQVASTGNIGLNNSGDTITLNDGSTDVVTYTYTGTSSDDQSQTRDPDISGASFVLHSTATGAGGALYSPGTMIDGSNFSGCTPPPPNLSIDDVTQNEGDAGTSTFTFTVSIDGTSMSDVTFDYATMDGSALVSDSDYVAITTTAGMITAGNLTTTIDVTVNGDTTAEGDENFSVELSNVVGAVLVDGSGLGTITNDDASVPDLTIDDVTALEGDSGTQTYTFTVSLSAPAPAGGVSFTFNTVNDTATTADSDYVGISPSFGAITAGNSSTTIDVTVYGDTVGEPDEQFFVNIGSASNANILDGVGIGTIQNDDLYPIWQIQGSGAFSPMVPGATLGSITSGSTVDIQASVVTAVAYRASDNAQQAFFMQTPDADSDGNMATSDGIYVYSTTPVAVGDLVTVSGTVQEFYGTTEIGSATVSVDSSGNALPTAVTFSTGSGMPSLDPTALTCPGSGPGGTNNDDTNFECFEGMLVNIPEAIALQGNRRRTNDDYAELQFTPRAQRSLREQGVRYPDATTLANSAAGAWDGNPEVMEMDPDIARRGTSGPTPAIDTEIVGGATFSATGVLTFDYGDYVFWPTALTIDAASNVLPRPVDTPTSTELSIGSFNMLRFCDTITGEHVYTCESPEPDQTALDAKLVKLSAYVREVLLSPDVVGVQEVETQAVLADLATQISADGGPTYTAYLVEGNDGGGIDVGYLVKDSRIRNASVTQYLKGETWDDPDCSPCADPLHDRPPLLLEADFEPTIGGPPIPFAIINNHIRSRGGVDTGNDRVRAKRFTQARSIAQLVQDFQSASGPFSGQGTDEIPLIMVGDYNAYQFTDGYADVVGMIAGTYDDSANTCAPGNAVTNCKLGGPNIVSPALQNLVLSVDANEQYSFQYRENFGAVMGYGTPNPARDVATGQILDHVLANQLAVPYVTNIQYGRANTDASINGAELGSGPDGAGGTQLSEAIGSSDHDGLVAYFETDCSGALAGDASADTDNDGICQLIDNCPDDANSDQTDANGNGLGADCDATPMAVNDPAAGNYAATEDNTLNIPATGLLANDTDDDGDSLTASLVDDSAANGSVTVNADGSFGYTPNLNFCDDANPVSFTYQASDGETTSAATASILVACENDAPTISDIPSPQMTDEEVSLMVAFTINDVDSTLACSAANLAATSSNESLMPVGDIVFGGTAPNCTATLTPATNQVGNSTIRLTVSDGSLDAFDEFVLTVSNVDDPAVLMDDTASLTEDDPATAINVLVNDSDPDSTLQITAVSDPAHGTVVVTGGGTGLTYEPDANYCNDGAPTDDFTYDANGQTATVRVTVFCQNDDAVATDDRTTVTQNSTGNVIDVLTNDTADPDFALSIDDVDTNSAQGGTPGNDGSQITFTPFNGFCGTDTFDYTLVGGSSATVTVTVNCLGSTIFADGFED